MTRTPDKLWDGSDPLYAPHTARTNKWLYWKVPAKYRNAGYAIKSVRLVGEIGDERDVERAQMARELTREMIRWFEDDTPKVEPGTWKWLIGRYLTDEFSPFHEIKSVTQDSYRSRLASWEEAIGYGIIEDVNYTELKCWQKAMKDNGRGQHYIKAQFTMLRILVGYGKAIGAKGCADIKDILSEMRIKGPKPRTIAPTSEQVEAVINEADKSGDSMFALGLSLQWWFSLRGVDVIGQWLRLGKDDPRENGGAKLVHGSGGLVLLRAV